MTAVNHLKTPLDNEILFAFLINSGCQGPYPDKIREICHGMVHDSREGTAVKAYLTLIVRVHTPTKCSLLQAKVENMGGTKTSHILFFEF